MYPFARDAITKFPKPGGLKNRSTVSHSSEGYRSKTEGSAESAPPDGWEGDSDTQLLPGFGAFLSVFAVPQLGLCHPAFLPHLHRMSPSVHVCLCVHNSPLFMLPCDFILTNCICNNPVSK